ncbi:MAG: type II toxin-antitoxin system VapB family antitoxin [Myxococcales bacterium]|nr:type II toxin-antitoxin system VapB family antitoxin [Myxococcales bacterium]
MALSIKSPEADRLARKLAAATHESITEAVTRALAERLERVERRDSATRRNALRQIRERVSALPTLDARTDDEVLG